jgi:NADH-quinone oxidoreductase subunit C
MEQKAIYDLLAETLGEAALGFSDESGDPVADVAPEKIAEAALFLRDDERLSFDQLMCLSGIDWDGFDEAGKGKSVAILGYTQEGAPEQSDRVGEGDFGVVYNLYSHSQKHKFTLRVRVPRDVASVPTVSTVWSTAGWHEREAWDLVGIRFAGHQDLRRMLMEESWVGHPLRKDYQMPDQWENVPMAGKALCVNPFATEVAEPPETPDAPAGEGQ